MEGVQMSGKNNESLYNDVMAFAMSNDSPASEAAKRFAQKLRESRFKSDDFNARCVAFLTARAVDLLGMDDSLITQFIEQCAEHDAEAVITRMVDTYIENWFDIDIDKLSHIAITLGKNDFNKDAERCFVKAESLVPKS